MLIILFPALFRRLHKLFAIFPWLQNLQYIKAGLGDLIKFTTRSDSVILQNQDFWHIPEKLQLMSD